MEINPHIRKLAKAEFNTAISLAWEVFQEYEAPDYSEQGIQEFYQTIHDQNWLDSLQIYGAFHQTQLLGLIAARSQSAHIALFFVKGTYQKQGIGRKLLGYLLADNPAPTVTVNSSPYAVPIYQHLGFHPTAPEQTTNGLRYTPMKLTL